MVYSDRQLMCSACGSDFTFSAAEQEGYAGLCYPYPHRCPSCRAARKSTSRGSGVAILNSDSRTLRSYSPGPMYPAVCDDCGRETQVPAEPQGNHPVYCSDCFARKKS